MTEAITQKREREQREALADPDLRARIVAALPAAERQASAARQACRALDTSDADPRDAFVKSEAAYQRYMRLTWFVAGKTHHLFGYHTHRYIEEDLAAVTLADGR